MQFIKTRNVKSPERDVNENAGIDFYIPENNEDFANALKAKNANLFLFKGISSFKDLTPEDLTKPEMLTLISVFAGKTTAFDTANGKIYIAPHSQIIIPTGIKSKFAPNLALIANNKSGIATKKELLFGASVIDASYQGEWHINLHNVSDKFQTLECGTKVIQFIPHLISTDPVEIVDMTAEEFYADTVSKRGEGWQGSTGDGKNK